jgi:predicted transcriptional regulator
MSSQIERKNMPEVREDAQMGMIEKLHQEIELVGRHLDVIRVVEKHQPIGIMKLAELLDLPYHRVRYSLRVLEQFGYIRASPAGAVATSEAEELLKTLDDQIEQIIGELKSMKEKNIHNI